MCWNYFTFSHGKGKVDDVGAFLKHEICKEHIKPQDQLNGYKMFMMVLTSIKNTHVCPYAIAVHNVVGVSCYCP